MKVLVTGSKGQVGSCLVEQLNNRAWQWKALDRHQLDICDRDRVFELFKEYRPDVVINAAAYTAVDKAETEIDAAYAINRDGSMYLAEAAEATGAAIFHISTDYVFSGEGAAAYVETDITSPQGVYGASKLAGEKAIANVCNRHIILRTAWVFGEHGNNFVKTMLKLGQTREQLSIVGDQFGGPTYAGDIAATILAMVDKLDKESTLDWGIYHYSGLPHVSWFEFAQTIFEEAKNKNLINNIPALTSIPTKEYPTPAVRPANSRLNCDKIVNKMVCQPSDWGVALDNIKAYLD